MQGLERYNPESFENNRRPVPSISRNDITCSTFLRRMLPKEMKAMTGAEGIGGGAAAYFASLAQSVQATKVAGGLSGGEGAGGLSGGEGGGGQSVSISGIGQLLSALQQLQSQSPDEFTQVVSKISSELQSEAQQQGPTSQGNALSDLATQFQNVANTGDLSLLQLRPHAHNGGVGAYGSNGQPAASSSAGGSNSFQQLFADLASEVTAALST